MGIGVNGQGKGMGYQKQYTGGFVKKSGGNNEGDNFRTIKSVLEGSKFVNLMGQKMRGDQTIVYDYRGNDIDDATMKVLDELKSIGRVVRVEKLRKDYCRVYFPDGSFYNVASYSNRFLAWAYKKIYEMAVKRGINEGLIKYIK